MMNTANPGLSRRDFVGGAAAVGAVAAVGAATAGAAFADAGEAPASGRVTVLFDASACVGCRYCEGACRNANGLAGEVAFNVAALDGTVYPKGLLPYESIRASKAAAVVAADDRSADRWLRVVQVPQGDAVANTRRSCMHCGLCAEVCPSGAIQWRDDGLVAVDSSRCFGCYYCYQACPFDVPRYPEKGAEDRGMRKCTGCAARIDEGGAPACVEACPAGALQFGSFEDMRAAGEAKVASLGGSAVLYGVSELGGMNVLSVLPQGAKAAGLPVL